eukprot:TRINITY_DN71655_c0_g1_i1.p1 TRINITY_DN71655_c0_g1~~TRINITY_DN71655_c0_g1_i1.p1  ORF type:complete len:106 (+),score=17.93 TRINITY_DN71655_c0_g1_i1:30-347(+)
MFKVTEDALGGSDWALAASLNWNGVLASAQLALDLVTTCSVQSADAAISVDCRHFCSMAEGEVALASGSEVVPSAHGARDPRLWSRGYMSAQEDLQVRLRGDKWL